MFFFFRNDGEGFAHEGGGEKSWRMLQSRAREILSEIADAVIVSSSPEAESRALDAAVACGYCRLFGGEPPEFAFPAALAPVAATRLVTLVDASASNAENLPAAWDAAIPADANGLVADLLQARMDCWAALETLDAIDEELPDDAALAAGIASCDEAVSRFDRALFKNLDFLATLTDTPLLANWRLSLAPAYRDPLPWWLDGTLEVAAVAVDSEIADMERTLLQPSLAIIPAQSRSGRIRERVVQTYAAAADVSRVGEPLTPLCQWRSPDGNLTASLLPPPGGPQVNPEKLVLVFEPGSEGSTDVLRGCVAVLGGNAVPIAWRTVGGEKVAIAEFQTKAVLEAENVAETVSTRGGAGILPLVVLPEGGSWTPV